MRPLLLDEQQDELDSIRSSLVSDLFPAWALKVDDMTLSRIVAKI